MGKEADDLFRTLVDSSGFAAFPQLCSLQLHIQAGSWLSPACVCAALFLQPRGGLTKTFKKTQKLKNLKVRCQLFCLESRLTSVFCLIELHAVPTSTPPTPWPRGLRNLAQAPHFATHPLRDLTQPPSCPVPQFPQCDKEKFGQVDSCLNLGGSRTFSMQERGVTGGGGVPSLFQHPLLLHPFD